MIYSAIPSAVTVEGENYMQVRLLAYTLAPHGCHIQGQYI